MSGATTKNPSLTDRERYALRMLRTHRSGAAIARELGVTRQRAHALIKTAKSKMAAIRQFHLRGKFGRDFSETEDELLAA